MVSVNVDNEKLIEEMMLDAEEAPEPGLNAKQIIHSGDETLPAPMIASALTSAGYAYIYDTETGDRSLTNRNMLPAQLRKMRPNGKPYFTTKDPGFRPPKGELVCWFHPDSPRWPEFRDIGWAECKRTNLFTDWQVREHVRKKHSTRWQAILGMEEEQRRNEDRAFQQALLEAARGGTKTADPSIWEQTCDECGQTFRSTGKIGLWNKLKAHNDKTHPPKEA